MYLLTKTILVLVLVSLYLTQNVMSRYSQLSQMECNEDPRTQPVFTSLDQVLKLLDTNEYRDIIAVQQLIFAFFNTCQSKRTSYLPKPSRRPFIVVEGHHRTAKKILAMQLSRRMSATLIGNPPRCLNFLRNLLPVGSLLLRAFFNLSSYALAQATRRIINLFPVVLNGYWLEQQIYAIARTYGTNPPPPDHLVYQWPKDLLKPDIIFFIAFPDNLHKEILTTRSPDSHKNLAVNALHRINITNLVVINTTLGLDVALKEMERHIEERLTHRWNIEWHNITRGPSRVHLKNIRVKQG